MDTPLDDILSDDVAPEVEAPAIEQPRDEHGKFASKGVEPEVQETVQTEAVPPTDKLPEPEYKAIREEREKRQTLEKELEALKQQIQQVQNPPAPPPDIWEDTPGWQQHLKNEIVQQTSIHTTVQMSEMLMRQAEPDFENLKAQYLELEKANPSIIPQVMSDPHPWNKAIQIAKNHKQMQELGATSIDDLRAKLREEIMAEQGQPQTPYIPPTLTGERSVAARTGPAWTGPKPLSELVG